MAMTVLITLTSVGGDVTGPFDLYSSVDGFSVAFETGVTLASLLAGYLCIIVPDGSTAIVAQERGSCSSAVFLPISGVTTTTTTTSSTTTTTTTATPTTTTSTTPAPTTTSTTTEAPCTPVTYYQLSDCLGGANQYTLIFPTLGPGQQYVWPGAPNLYYTYTGGVIIDCTAPSGYNASIQIAAGVTGCP